MKVWLVFRETIRDTSLDSVWATEEDARKHAELVERDEGYDTMVEPYDVRHIDGLERCDG